MFADDREDKSPGEGDQGQDVPSDGRSARAQRQRESRRNQVLECALQVFSEKGYHNASITDIIEAAGIARGTFYLYFENKRAIFEELLDGFMGRIAKAVRRVQLGQGEEPPLEQIRTNIVRVLGVLTDNEAFTRLLLRQAVGLDTELDQRLEEFYGRVIDLIAAALTLGQEMGLVRTCDARVVASCILGSVKEMANQHLTQSGGKPPDREVLEQEIMDYNMKGIFRWER